MFKTSSTASLTKQSGKTRKESVEQKLIKTTSSVNVTNRNKTRKASKETETAAKKSSMSRKTSEVSTTSRKVSEAGSLKRSTSNASTVSVGAKSRENTFVKRTLSKQLLPDVGCDVPCEGVTAVEDTGVQNDR